MPRLGGGRGTGKDGGVPGVREWPYLGVAVEIRTARLTFSVDEEFDEMQVSEPQSLPLCVC